MTSPLQTPAPVSTAAAPGRAGNHDATLQESNRGGVAFALILLVILGVGAGALLFGGLPNDERLPLALVLGACAVTFAAAGLLARALLRGDTGGPAMQQVYQAIREGAEAFVRRQYRTIAIIATATAVLVIILYAVVRTPSPDDPATAGVLALATAAAFAFGATCSGVAGVLGMWMAVRTNVRVAAAARDSAGAALRTALRGGAVAGLVVPAMSLAGVAVLFTVYRAMGVAAGAAPLMVIGYGFGASFVALFAQLGGGIYTKAADVGADLVGKVEAGIPEDDPRNPAVVADLVGDNVGDCAGRGADLFESIAAENIGAMILGMALLTAFHTGSVLFPLVAAGAGLLASIVGVLSVRMREDEDPMSALNRGFYVTTVIAVLGLLGACWWLLRSPEAPHAWLSYFWCALIGVATSFGFVIVTEYYTEHRYRPVRNIADQSVTGAATNVIAGLAVGLESTSIPVLLISAAVIASYAVGASTGLPSAGLFGTAVATIGMLSGAGYILAMDNFGPITDNAGGIAEMSRQPNAVRERTDRLDAAGNTTKALTKGYALGSAGLAAFLLFSAYMDAVRSYGAPLEGVDLAKPAVFVGGLLGAALVFLFASTAIRAVGQAAAYVIDEVRRQFRERPGILAGTERPDYARCVDIVTRGALRRMVVPGMVAVGVPIATAILFRPFAVGAEGVAAFLMVGTIAGILVATLLNNGGGAWDNAKKYVELGAHGGKGSDAHKAAVIGDTVGDPFKDTAGPSIHVLIKLLATIMLVMAPFLA
ncbi:MAG TPA: sodium-translocating pyrophosphatase [Gemmatimonadaceae bacterium]|nr:sodium-translocating pyrophosphatase [Gemmatimonadaceae bacterium]